MRTRGDFATVFCGHHTRAMPNFIPEAEETDGIAACIPGLKNNSGKP